MNKEIFLLKYNIMDKPYPIDKKSKYIGEIFGYLKVLDIVYAASKNNQSNYHSYAKCLCLKCNKEIYTSWDAIRNGNTISCGCNKNIIASSYLLNQSKLKYIGKEFITNEGYKIKIIGLVNTHMVEIEFLDVKIKYKTWNTLQNIKNGQIKYPYHPNEYGGYYGVGPYPSRIDGVKTQEYRIWMGMLYRCNTSTTYMNVFVCDDWLNFQNFAKWYNDNKYDCILPLEIDKDILTYFSHNGKIFYSSENCVLIPQCLNRSLANIENMTSKEILKNISRFQNIIPKFILLKIKEYYKNAK